MNSATTQTVFDFGYKGEAYRLVLRTCSDGYVSGFERAGAEALVSGVMDGRGFFADTDRTDAFCRLVVDRAEDGLVQMCKAAGTFEWVSIPWRHWHEIPVETLEGLHRSFFHYLRAKIKPLISSSSATAILATLLDSTYEARTLFFSTTPEQPTASATSNGAGET